MAGAHATLNELARGGGQPLEHANRMGEKLMHGIREAAARHNIPATVSGFGAAFSIHFTQKKELRTYRDTLDDDSQRLARFIVGALDEGLYLLPDGRFYVSTAHGDSDISQTLDAIDRAFAAL